VYTIYDVRLSFARFLHRSYNVKPTTPTVANVIAYIMAYMMVSDFSTGTAGCERFMGGKVRISTVRSILCASTMDHTLTHVTAIKTRLGSACIQEDVALYTLWCGIIHCIDSFRLSPFFLYIGLFIYIYNSSSLYYLSWSSSARFEMSTFDEYNRLKKDAMMYVYALYPPLNRDQEDGKTFYMDKYLMYGQSVKTTHSLVELAEDLQCLFYMIAFTMVEEYIPYIDRTLSFKSPSMNRVELQKTLDALQKALVRALCVSVDC
jgi:hypothetical protein